MSDTLTRDLARKNRPKPDAAEDIARWEESDRRHRMLVGQWKPLATDYIAGLFDAMVAANMRSDKPDVSLNPLRLFAEQKAVLYQDSPTAVVDADPEHVTRVIRPTLWPLMASTNRYVAAMNDSFMRIDWRTGKDPKNPKGITYRPVTANFITATQDEDDPGQVVEIQETRWREKDGHAGWTWETWDVRDLERPVFKIEKVESDKSSGLTRRVDVTDTFYRPANGDPYPYRDPDERPVMNYVGYHNRVPTALWSPDDGIELVDGTLLTAALRTFWVHGFRNASWPINYSLDVKWLASKIVKMGNQEVQQLINDPTRMLQGNRTSSGGGVGQLTSHLDPLAGIQAINLFVAQLAMFAGFSPSDVQVSSVGSDSGAALTVRREGLRRVRKQQEQPFRLSDQVLLSRAAMIANRSEALDLPMEPEAWGIAYAPIGMTPDEIRAKVERVDAMVERGVADDVDVLQAFRPELTEEQAIDHLAHVAGREVRIEQARNLALLEAGGVPNERPPVRVGEE